MGWEDRPYYRDRGASSNRLTAIFAGSVPLFTAFGIRVRAHASLIFFVLLTLLLGWSEGYPLTSRLVSMAMLFVVVLLHEFGHCFAGRSVGGTAEEVLLTPLGGLAFPDIAKRPFAHFWTVLCVPLVNVGICLLSATGVYFLGRHFVVPLNPYNCLLIPADWIGWTNPLLYVWWIFCISYINLLFNVLPIFPLDGGRLVQCGLWKFIGYYRSMMVSCTIGMVGSGGLAIFAVLHKPHPDWMLILLAVCLFVYCQQQRGHLKEAGPEEPWQSEETDFSSSLHPDPPVKKSRVSRRAQRIARKHARQEATERIRLDALLAKVSTSGLRSLTWLERRELRAATERRRRHESELKTFLRE